MKAAVLVASFYRCMNAMNEYVLMDTKTSPSVSTFREIIISISGWILAVS
jgi:hypothetical protein